jgi:hypothetical protein
MSGVGAGGIGPPEGPASGPCRRYRRWADETVPYLADVPPMSGLHTHNILTKRLDVFGKASKRNRLINQLLASLFTPTRCCVRPLVWNRPIQPWQGATRARSMQDPGYPASEKAILSERERHLQPSCNAAARRFAVVYRRDRGRRAGEDTAEETRGRTRRTRRSLRFIGAEEANRRDLVKNRPRPEGGRRPTMPDLSRL